MFLEERQESIMNMLNADGKVRVKELSEKFGVTEDCIRKDLGSLEKQGRLKRTYGGAVVLRENNHVIEISKRKTTDVDAKRRIAHAAVKLIHDRDMVFLDISTSNLAINKSRDGFWGGMTMDFISRLKPDVAFVGAIGVDAMENSVSTYDIEDGINKAQIIRVSKKAYVVAEAKKLSTDGNYNYATLDTLSGLITDSMPSEKVCEALSRYGVQLIVP